MERYLVSKFYYDNGFPASGLLPVPSIDIWDITAGDHPIVAYPMVEVGGGWYKYKYTERDGNDYVSTVDAGNISGLSNRYCDGVSLSNYSGSLQQIQNTSDLIQTEVAALIPVIDFIEKMDAGSWELKDPNLLIFYEDDNVTTIATYLCYDAYGNPTIDDIKKVTRQY